jgi:chromosome segregation ATPase
MDIRPFRTYTAPEFFFVGNLNAHMPVMTEERQQIQLELEGLKRTLEWTEIQREQLLDRLDMLRHDNTRLQDRVEELERQVEGLKQQQPMF